ncbi:MAG: polyisoprenoid-binding protein, partial [Comamonas sp.]
MKTMFKTSVAIAALGLAAFSSAALADQVLVPAQSAINFEAKQMGVPLKGHFKKFDAKINF